MKYLYYTLALVISALAVSMYAREPQDMPGDGSGGYGYLPQVMPGNGGDQPEMQGEPYVGHLPEYLQGMPYLDVVQYYKELGEDTDEDEDLGYASTVTERPGR
jgi:hypothetical protein